MNITIRSETVKDYFQIAEVQALAFTYSQAMGEVPLVDVHRHRENYDPELSLVAVIEGTVVGHVLFSPHKMIVGGRIHESVILAPIAIHPDYQKRGIGTLLIDEGHKRCIEKGYQFSLLLGDPNYYPRFGYEINMYGTSLIDVVLKGIAKAELTERRVTTLDTPVLNEVWKKVFNKSDLAIIPGNSIINWISNSKDTRSSILEENGEFVGFIRYEVGNIGKIKSILARDEQSLVKLLGYIKKDISVDSISIPIPFNSNLIGGDIDYKTNSSSWSAGMIKVLNEENQEIISYIKQVKNKEREPGLVIWPVEFDVC